MTERVSAASLPTGKRIPAARLTPTERETLEKEGRISPDGFADIGPLEPPQMVDLQAEARRSAAEALRSVASVPPVPGVTPAPPGPAVQGPSPETAKTAEYQKGLHEEIARLNKELEERQGCPRCGLNLKEKYEVEPTQEDIEEFLKCVLAGNVYAKEYQLFGGKLKVSLRTRLGSEENLIKKAIVEFFKESQGASETEVYSELMGYSLAVSLQSYAGQGYPDLPLTNVTAFKAAVRERLDTLPSQVQGFLKTLLQQFNVLADKLTARAQDPSFWTGTAASR